MNLQDKIVCAHKGYFNKESQKSYRENSKELCQAASEKDYITAIELDIRKSKDGVLYCYHGTLMQYFFTLKIPRDFSALQRRYKVDSLAEILKVIAEDKMILLDLKDRSITKTDILNALGNRKFKEITLNHPWVSYLEKFNDMPENFVKFMISNIFCNFYNLGRLKERNYKYFEVVFPFQINKKVVESVSRSGLGLSCSSNFFRSKKSFWRKINKYKIQWVSADFI